VELQRCNTTQKIFLDNRFTGEYISRLNTVNRAVSDLKAIARSVNAFVEENRIEKGGLLELVELKIKIKVRL
jgi:hypothetical protein